MRLPFPERIPYPHAFVFSGVLACVQMLERSNPLMVGTVFCFTMVATTAFNIAGGMYYPSGAFVACNAVMTLLLPMVAKAFLGEAADRNLHSPLTTVAAYFSGMVGLLLAAIVSRHFRLKKSYMADKLPERDLQSAYRGSVVFCFVLGFIQSISSGGDGSIGSFLGQVNKFPALAYLLGVVATAYSTAGRRSVTWLLMGFMLYTSASGLLTFSKESFLIPFFCWCVGAAYMRYRLRWINVIALVLGLYITVTYMVPYAQVGRTLQEEGRDTRDLSTYMLSHMDEVRETYKGQTLDMLGAYHDYDKSISLLDRLDILAVDDGLVNVTERFGFFGYQPIIYSFYNYIPHFLWPSKPRVFYGNVYGHEIGVLPPEDGGTGVSFSFAADAYHEGGYFCLFVICPFLFMLIFTVLDSVVGDTRRNPVALVMTILIFRAASEGSLTVAINLIQQPLVATVIVGLTATYILPVIGRLIGKTEAPETLVLPQPQTVTSL